MGQRSFGKSSLDIKDALWLKAPRFLKVEYIELLVIELSSFNEIVRVHFVYKEPSHQKFEVVPSRLGAIVWWME